MKTRPATLTATISAMVLAMFFFSFSSTAIASGNHYKHSYDQTWFDKSSSKKSQLKKERFGKQCAKRQCDNSLSIPLYVEGDKRIGKVTVRLAGGDLKVTYQVTDGWYIKQTNLNVTDYYDALVKVDGSPDVKAYPYKSKHFTPVKSADYTISASQWPLGTELYVAAQAIVINKSYGKCKQHTARSHDYKSKGHSGRKTSHGKKEKKLHSNHIGTDYEGNNHDTGRHDEKHDEYDHKHHDHDGQPQTSKEMDAWAVGEKFPGQDLAAYFVYKLESCDQVQLSTIQFSDSIYTVSEQGPAAVITVLRSGNIDLAASVEYTTMDGSAVNGADYEFTTGVLDFAPGQSSAQFMVTPIDDSDVEDIEALSLQLSNPLGATLGQQRTAILEIEDNDEAAVAVIAIDRIEPNPVDEGTTVIIYVTRTGDLSVSATVDFSTIDGTAIGATQCGAPAAPVPFDYEHAGGTLFFDAGVSELSIEVATCNNNPRGDTDETFDIEIYNPMGAVLADDGDGNPHSNIETITINEAS